MQKNQAGKIASIQSIHRYVVKSMAGEMVERCYLTESGLHGDRLYAFESSGAQAEWTRRFAQPSSAEGPYMPGIGAPSVRRSRPNCAR